MSPRPMMPERALAPWILVLLGASCTATWTEQPTIHRADLPRFPTVAQMDYEVADGIAHAAGPRFDESARRFVGRGRIWLKGSASHSRVAVGADSEQRVIRLEPPYFTAVVEADPGPTDVLFIAENEPVAGGAGKLLQVQVPSAEDLNARRDRFSLMTFGCFQPFDLDLDRGPDGGAAIVASGSSAAESPLWRLRRAFAATARGEWIGAQVASWIIGCGDQIYVDAAYHRWGEVGSDHPLAAWTVESRPRPRCGLGAFADLLDACYRSFWSFSTIDLAFRTCPTLFTWDDHEIRDGWGSQGDEHVYRDTYYAVAREAYHAHQVARGPTPRSDRVAALEAPLHQQLAVHGVPIFALDLRSSRDISVPRVMDEVQWAALENWFGRLDGGANQVCVLVSSMPIFYRFSDLADLAADESAHDDLHDHWSSEINAEEYRRLVRLIVEASRRGVRTVIVSGDLHLAAFSRVTAVDPDGGRRVVAYELITSGLATLEKSAFEHAVTRSDLLFPDPVTVDEERVVPDLGFESLTPNFGMLEFDHGSIVAHVVCAEGEQLVRYRTPLDWTPDPEDGGLADVTTREGLEAPAPESISPDATRAR